MKLTPLIAFASALFLFSCDNSQPEPTPVQPTELKALRKIEAGITRELVYAENGKLSEQLTITQTGTGEEWTVPTQYLYDATGRLKESTTDVWRLVYFYTGDKITATDEYVSGTLSQQHQFVYDVNGLLTTKTTTQNIPEEGGIIPVAREEYEYDANGNVTVMELYYYTTFAAESHLLTRFVFSDYDDKISSDEYFNLIAYNPILKLKNNNPGHLEITNGSGILSITEDYTYEYHSRGYATRKTTLTTSHDGSTGESVVEYEFE